MGEAGVQPLPEARDRGGGGVLQRVLGLRTIVSTSAGLAFAAVNFLTVMEIRSSAPGLFGPLTILVAGALCLLAAAVFSELNGTLPSAAGIRVWTLRGIGDPFSLSFTLLYLTTVLLVIAADGFVLGGTLHVVIPGVPAFLWILAFLGLALWSNLRGIRMAGLVQDMTTYLLLLALIVVSAVGLLGPHLQVVHHAVPSAAGFATAIALGVFIFTGFEWVTPLSEEVRDPRRMPAGLGLALLLLAVGFSAFAAVAGRLPMVPATALAPQLAVGQRALGGVGFWVMFSVTVVTAGTTFNGGFAAASRLVYALGRSRYLPTALGKLNRDFVPGNALWLLCAVAMALTVLVYATRAYLLLINAGAALESAMYVVAALALLGLRRRHPELPRTWRAPGGRFIPIATIVLFAGLAVAAAVTATGLPVPWMPWPLVLLVVLALLAVWYVRGVLARRKPRTAAGARA